jgi:hypothetical protein
MNPEEILKFESIISMELQDAWSHVLEDELLFGEVCYRWREWYKDKPHVRGDRLRYMWKSLGIPPTAAYKAMYLYEASIGKQKEVDIKYYSAQELAHMKKKAENENRLEHFFKGCGYKFYVKQNCATNDYHFNVIFSALPEKEVKELAKRLKKSKETKNVS